jgi:hypothetical protein
MKLYRVVALLCESAECTCDFQVGLKISRHCPSALLSQEKDIVPVHSLLLFECDAAVNRGTTRRA